MALRTRLTEALGIEPMQAAHAMDEGVFHRGGDESTEGVDAERECYPAGQAVGDINAVTPAGDIVRGLVEEAEAVLRRIGSHAVAV